MSRVNASTRFSLYLLLWSVVLQVFIFWEPLTSGRMLFHPDWAPYFEAGNVNGFWRLFVEVGRVPSFVTFMWALLPDHVFHTLFYPVMTFAVWAVMYVFLRNRMLPRAAAMAGAVSCAFSGYLLTLVSAGHRGVSEAMLSIVIVLLCVDRLVRGGSIWFGIAAALAINFTLGTQPDVLALMGMFVAVYAALSCWWHRADIFANKKRFFVTLVVAGLVFLVTALPAVERIRGSFLPGREAEITRSMGSATDTGPSEEERWEFVTNWSMPPADMPEFILPLFFGTETTDQSAPFWGELGRSMNWEPGRPGFRNFRQHTVYMGLLQVLLAIFVCGCLLSKRCRQQLFLSDDERRQVIFWVTCAIVALLLSLGRYTPIYRLFYAIPLAHTIRAPIKFLHVVNLSVAILTAYGVTFLLRAFVAAKKQKEMRDVACSAAKWLAVGSMGLAGFLLLVALVVWGASASIAAGWSQMGFDATLHPAMRRHMFMALWRSIVLAVGFALCLYLLVLRRRAPAWSPTALSVLLCAVIGLDMAVTGRRFVNTIDLTVHESENAIVDDIKGSIAPRMMDMLTSRQTHDPLRVNFERYHAASVRLLDADVANADILPGAVGNDINRLVRLLQVTSTEYVVGPRQQLEPWLQHPAFSLAGEYVFADRIISAGQQRQGTILLLQVEQTLPRASWVPAARPVAEDAIPDEVFRDYDPRREVLIVGHEVEFAYMQSGSEEMLPAQISDWSRWKVVIDDIPSEGGLLLLNDPFHSHWKAHADGEPIDILLANGAMMAVQVPAYVEQVVFLRRPGIRFFWTITVPTLVLQIWVLGLGIWCLLRKHDEESVA